ncbi:hypothetical protein RP20_CCG025627 [Aedes albopictus]|nr:hypothetical protein RP20_CCG025627 [Aedes albopictus]
MQQTGKCHFELHAAAADRLDCAGPVCCWSWCFVDTRTKRRDDDVKLQRKTFIRIYAYYPVVPFVAGCLRIKLNHITALAVAGDGVFLICWVPFFTCNIMDAMCTKLDMTCQPGVTAFILTTWLGYMNSFVNPVIYTIFNPEFRKAFKKIMNIE